MSESSQLRYGQCWEDADVLLRALQVAEGDICLSIASAGDNTLSLLACDPARVIAVDENPAQLAALELRVAAFNQLDHESLLELVGARCSTRRIELYNTCRPHLSGAARHFWDQNTQRVAEGIAGAGRLERNFELFRRCFLPLVHSADTMECLLRGGSRRERQAFYRQRWNTPTWRLLVRTFFSRWVLSRLGRSAAYFTYARMNLPLHLLRRIPHAVVELDPQHNPYLQWMLTGKYTTALPHWLRAENFESIRENLHRLEWHCVPLQEYLRHAPERSIGKFNLSDVFEYMPSSEYQRVLREVARCGREGARVAYWNMLVQRRRPSCLSSSLRPLQASTLHREDRVIFYRDFVLEEVC